MSVFVLLKGGMTPPRVSPVAGQGKPIDLIPIGSIPQGVKDTFQHGALSMYTALQRQRIPVRHTVLAYQLDAHITDRMHGDSGALAFAIAAMYRMLGQQPTTAIAATGAIHDIGSGTIAPVDSIREKLAYALDNLDDGVLFYPYEHADEIAAEEALQQKAVQHGINLCPVRDLNDVITYLLSPKKSHGLLPYLS